MHAVAAADQESLETSRIAKLSIEPLLQRLIPSRGTLRPPTACVLSLVKCSQTTSICKSVKVYNENSLDDDPEADSVGEPQLLIIRNIPLPVTRLVLLKARVLSPTIDCEGCVDQDIPPSQTARSEESDPRNLLSSRRQLVHSRRSLQMIAQGQRNRRRRVDQKERSFQGKQRRRVSEARAVHQSALAAGTVSQAQGE